MLNHIIFQVNPERKKVKRVVNKCRMPDQVGTGFAIDRCISLWDSVSVEHPWNPMQHPAQAWKGGFGVGLVTHLEMDALFSS
jgi:hypothetical protein